MKPKHQTGARKREPTVGVAHPRVSTRSQGLSNIRGLVVTRGNRRSNDEGKVTFQIKARQSLALVQYSDESNSSELEEPPPPPPPPPPQAKPERGATLRSRQKKETCERSVSSRSQEIPESKSAATSARGTRSAAEKVKEAALTWHRTLVAGGDTTRSDESGRRDDAGRNVRDTNDSSKPRHSRRLHKRGLSADDSHSRDAHEASNSVTHGTGDGVRRDRSRDGDDGVRRGRSRDDDDRVRRGRSRDGDDSVRRGRSRDGDDSVRRGRSRDGDDSVRRGRSRDGDDSVRRGRSRDGDDSVCRDRSRDGDDSVCRDRSHDGGRGRDGDRGRDGVRDKDKQHRHARVNESATVEQTVKTKTDKKGRKSGGKADGSVRKSHKDVKVSRRDLEKKRHSKSKNVTTPHSSSSSSDSSSGSSSSSSSSSSDSSGSSSSSSSGSDSSDSDSSNSTSSGGREKAQEKKRAGKEVTKKKLHRRSRVAGVDASELSTSVELEKLQCDKQNRASTGGDVVIGDRKSGKSDVIHHDSESSHADSHRERNDRARFGADHNSSSDHNVGKKTRSDYRRVNNHDVAGDHGHSDDHIEITVDRKNVNDHIDATGDRKPDDDRISTSGDHKPTDDCIGTIGGHEPINDHFHTFVDHKPVSDHIGKTGNNKSDDDHTGTTDDHKPVNDHLHTTIDHKHADDHVGTTIDHEAINGHFHTSGDHKPVKDHIGKTGDHEHVDDSVDRTGDHRPIVDHTGATLDHKPINDHIGSTTSDHRHVDHIATTIDSKLIDDHINTTLDVHIARTPDHKHVDDHIDTTRDHKHVDDHIDTTHAHKPVADLIGTSRDHKPVNELQPVSDHVGGTNDPRSTDHTSIKDDRKIVADETVSITDHETNDDHTVVMGDHKISDDHLVTSAKVISDQKADDEATDSHAVDSHSASDNHRIDMADVLSPKSPGDLSRVLSPKSPGDLSRVLSPKSPGDLSRVLSPKSPGDLSRCSRDVGDSLRERVTEDLSEKSKGVDHGSRSSSLVGDDSKSHTSEGDAKSDRRRHTSSETRRDRDRSRQRGHQERRRDSRDRESRHRDHDTEDRHHDRRSSLDRDRRSSLDYRSREHRYEPRQRRRRSPSVDRDRHHDHRSRRRRSRSRSNSYDDHKSRYRSRHSDVNVRDRRSRDSPRRESVPDKKKTAPKVIYSVCNLPPAELGSIPLPPMPTSSTTSVASTTTASVVATDSNIIINIDDDSDIENVDMEDAAADATRVADTTKPEPTVPTQPPAPKSTKIAFSMMKTKSLKAPRALTAFEDDDGDKEPSKELTKCVLEKSLVEPPPDPDSARGLLQAALLKLNFKVKKQPVQTHPQPVQLKLQLAPASGKKPDCSVGKMPAVASIKEEEQDGRKATFVDSFTSFSKTNDARQEDGSSDGDSDTDSEVSSDDASLPDRHVGSETNVTASLSPSIGASPTPVPLVAVSSMAVPHPPVPSIVLPPVAVPSIAFPPSPVQPVTVPSIAIPPAPIQPVAVPSIAVTSAAVQPIAVQSIHIQPIAVPSIAIPPAPVQQIAVPSIAFPPAPVQPVAVPSIAIPPAPVQLVSVPSIAIPPAPVQPVAVPSIAVPSIAVPPAPVQPVAVPSIAVPPAPVRPVAVPSIAVPPAPIRPVAVPSIALPPPPFGDLPPSTRPFSGAIGVPPFAVPPVPFPPSAVRPFMPSMLPVQPVAAPVSSTMPALPNASSVLASALLSLACSSLSASMVPPVTPPTRPVPPTTPQTTPPVTSRFTSLLMPDGVNRLHSNDAADVGGKPAKPRHRVSRWGGMAATIPPNTACETLLVSPSLGGSTPVVESPVGGSTGPLVHHVKRTAENVSTTTSAKAADEAGDMYDPFDLDDDVDEPMDDAGSQQTLMRSPPSPLTGKPRHRSRWGEPRMLGESDSRAEGEVDNIHSPTGKVTSRDTSPGRLPVVGIDVRLSPSHDSELLPQPDAATEATAKLAEDTSAASQQPDGISKSDASQLIVADGVDRQLGSTAWDHVISGQEVEGQLTAVATTPNNAVAPLHNLTLPHKVSPAQRHRGRRSSARSTQSENSEAEGVESHAPTRRRSSRLKCLEEKKERANDPREDDGNDCVDKPEAESMGVGPVEAAETKKDKPVRESDKRSGKRKRGGRSRWEKEPKAHKDSAENVILDTGTIGDVTPTITDAVSTTTPSVLTSPAQAVDMNRREQFASSRPEKVKSRWLRFSEMEAEAQVVTCPSSSNPDLVALSDVTTTVLPPVGEVVSSTLGVVTEAVSLSEGRLQEELLPDAAEDSASEKADIHSRLIEIANAESASDQDAPPPPPPPPLMPPPYDDIIDNMYVSQSRDRSKARKQARRMVCDCTVPQPDELKGGMQPCGDDCLNRLLMIECGSRCPCGDACTNKRFQKHQYMKTQILKTGSKGWGLNAMEDLEPGEFIIEYVGEVLEYAEFRARAKIYSKVDHFYFMALNANEILDAAKKGNASRFINHSCDPNCETQKWTVNGQLRVGFFAIRHIPEAEELTFDYRFERYGKEAQKCCCGAANCRGYIGGEKTKTLRSLETGRSKPSSSTPKVKKEKRMKEFDDLDLEEEIEKMTQLGGLRRRAHVLELARLMVRSESTEQRLVLLRILQDTKETACLRLFLDYHGLSLIWSWMVDVAETAIEFKTQILHTLKLLPINNLTMLKESKILTVVHKWAAQLSDSTAGTTGTSRTETGESSDGSAPTVDKDTATTVVSSSSMDVSASSALLSGVVFEGIPHKKRFRILRLQSEEASSSDSEVFDLCKAPTEREKVEDGSGVEEGNAESGEKVEDGSGVEEGNAESGEKREDGSGVEEGNAESGEKREDGSGVDEGNAESEHDAIGNEAVAAICATGGVDTMSESSQEALELGQGDASKASNSCVTELASVLLTGWVELKEEFKIPKREEVEERKKMEQELEQRYHSDSDRSSRRDRGHHRSSSSHHNDRSRDRERSRDHDRDRKRYYDDSPERSRSAKKSRQTEEERRAEKELEREELRILKARKVLLPTPPKISKKARREMFEAQIKAKDEMQEMVKQQQMELQLQDPATAAAAYQYYQQQGFIDYPGQGEYPPAAAPGSHEVVYQDAAGMPLSATYQDGTAVIQMPTGPGISMAVPQGPIPQQVAMAAPVAATSQFIMQPDGTLIPAPQPVQPTPSPAGIVSPAQVQQQSVMQPVMADPITQALIAQPMQPVVTTQAQFVDPAQPQVVYQVAPTPQSYIQPQTMPPVQGTPQTLSYVQPPQQQQQPPAMMQAVQPQTIQQVYYTTPQGQVIVQQQPLIQEQQLIQMQPVADLRPRDPREPPPPPPSPPPKPRSTRLPPNWKTARDGDGKLYYYHTVTRQTQWDTPCWETGEQEDDMDLGTPTHDEPKVKKKATTAAADTSTEVAKRIKDSFRSKISRHIVTCLNPFRRPDCKAGRINNTDDFKHLARKITHAVLDKELKHCRHVEDLEVNENVKAKARDYVKKYMGRFGTIYKKSANSP